MLDPPELVRYLLESGRLEPAAIVDGELAIEPVPRRNANYRVTTHEGPQYFVKQAVGPETAGTLAREAAVYRALEAAAGPVAARYLPRLYDHDEQRGLLVIELLRDARDLRGQFSGGRFSTRLAAAAGRALGQVHRETRSAAAVPGVPELDPPWAAALHRPAIDWLRDLSGADVELIALVQRSADFCSRLEAIPSAWRRVCVIHGDYKWDNCLALRGKEGRGTSVRLVDWEAGGRGDPAWDVGSAFTDFLSDWLLSIPLGVGPQPGLAALARRPLARMRPALESFWVGYRRAARLSGADANEFLVRATQFGGVRLLQTAFEHGQHAAEMSSNHATLAQLAFNVLRRPHEATVHLLGIPFESPAAA